MDSTSARNSSTEPEITCWFTSSRDVHEVGAKRHHFPRQDAQWHEEAGLYPQVDKAVWGKPWSVHGKSVSYGETTFEYMADYLFRVGIVNGRSVRCEEGTVTFWYTESKTKRRITVTLPVFDFSDRFFRHVLPKGFVKVRYAGFYAPGVRAKLAAVGELLGADNKTQRKPNATPPDTII